MQFEVFAQGHDGAGAVADAILNVGAEFGKGLVVALGDKYGVVAETLVATFLRGDATIDNAVEEEFAAAVDIGNDGAEAGIAVRVALQFFEQELSVGFGVVAVGIGIARRVNARASAECLYFKARIVGKAVVAVVGIYKLRLEQGVTLERFGGLGNITKTVNIVEAEHLILTSEYRTNLGKFVGIVGGKHQFGK